MNKKDCENIGYLLSEVSDFEYSQTLSDLLRGLLNLDPRIKENYQSFLDTPDYDIQIINKVNDLIGANVLNRGYTKYNSSLIKHVKSKIKNDFSYDRDDLDYEIDIVLSDVEILSSTEMYKQFA